MTADREALRQAVLKALHDTIPVESDGKIRLRVLGIGRYPKEANPERLADAIVDAVLAAEHTKHEWAYRYPNGHVATLPAALATEQVVRAAVAEHPDLLTAVRRRVTEWQDTPDGET